MSDTSLTFIDYVEANGCRVYVGTYPPCDGDLRTETVDTKDTDWDDVTSVKLIKIRYERLFVPRKGLWIEVRYKL